MPARSTDEADSHALVVACVAEVAATLSKERTALVDALYRRLSTDIEPLRGDDSLTRLMSGSIDSNVSTFLDILRYGIDVTGVEVPPTAVEYARRLAQHGVPVRALVRAYRLGQDSFLQRSFAVLNARVPDSRLVAAAGQLLTTTAFAYIDQVTERVFEAYEEERERWLQQRDAARDACVQELLRGDRVDLGAAERTLGYQLTGRRHIGLIVWTAQHEQFPAGASDLARFTRDLAGRLGSRARPLLVPRDQVTGWAWLPLCGPSPLPEELRAAAQPADEGVVVAVGEPGSGVDGFRRSHQQACTVQAMMLAAGREAPGLATFGEVGPVALLGADLPATRAWVGETLGRLALDDEPHARLRETLRVFLATGGSYVSAAEQLALHRNSVHYRVRKAEEQLGRPIQVNRLNVEIALTACRWLGRSVLTETP